MKGINLNNSMLIADDEASYAINCINNNGVIEYKNYSNFPNDTITKVYNREYSTYYDENAVSNNSSSQGVFDKLIYKDDSSNDYYTSGIKSPNGIIKFDLGGKAGVKVFEDFNTTYNELVDQKLVNDVYNYYKTCMIYNNVSIGITYSNNYGESGLARITIPNNIIHYILDINFIGNSFVDTNIDNYKYLNIYVKYGDMTKFVLTDKFLLSELITNRTQNKKLSNDNLCILTQDDRLLYYSGLFTRNDKSLDDKSWFISYRLKDISPTTLFNESFLSNISYESVNNTIIIDDTDIIDETPDFRDNFIEIVTADEESDSGTISNDTINITVNKKYSISNDVSFTTSVSSELKPFGSICSGIDAGFNGANTGRTNGYGRSTADYIFRYLVVDTDTNLVLGYTTEEFNITNLSVAVQFRLRPSDITSKCSYLKSLYSTEHPNLVVSFEVWYNSTANQSDTEMTYSRIWYASDIESFNEYDLDGVNTKLYTSINDFYEGFSRSRDGFSGQAALYDNPLIATKVKKTYITIEDSNEQFLVIYSALFLVNKVIFETPNQWKTETRSSILYNTSSEIVIPLAEYSNGFNIGSIKLNANRLSDYHRYSYWHREFFDNCLIVSVSDSLQYKPKKVYWSNINMPEVFSEENFYVFDDIVTGIHTLNTNCYIFTESNIYMISPYLRQSDEILTKSFNLIKIFNKGAFEFTISKHDNSIYFTNTDGVFVLKSNSSIELVSTKISKLFDDLKVTNLSINYGICKDNIYTLNFKPNGFIDCEYFGIDRSVYNDDNYNMIYRLLKVSNINYDIRNKDWYFGSDTYKGMLYKTKAFYNAPSGTLLKTKQNKRISVKMVGTLKINQILNENRSSGKFYLTSDNIYKNTLHTISPTRNYTYSFIFENTSITPTCKLMSFGLIDSGK